MGGGIDKQYPVKSLQREVICLSHVANNVTTTEDSLFHVVNKIVTAEDCLLPVVDKVATVAETSFSTKLVSASETGFLFHLFKINVIAFNGTFGLPGIGLLLLLHVVIHLLLRLLLLARMLLHGLLEVLHLAAHLAGGPEQGHYEVEYELIKQIAYENDEQILK